MPSPLILLCDDDPLLVELMTLRLQSKGYRVVSAADGATALELVRARKPTLVILDAMMPVLDGFAVLKKVRGDPESADLPIIMLTAKRQERDVLDALQAGATDYIVKPFSPEEVLARVARVLRSSPR
jgi:DNA-binding response OmpR family regulator